MMSYKLLPCPFCGSEAQVICDGFGAALRKVVCKKDNCIANNMDTFYRTSEAAMAAWNRRAKDAQEGDAQ